MSMWRDMFTGRDNKTIDIGRILWFESVNAYIALTAYQIYKGGTFDAIAWGAGLAALLGAGGAAIGLKVSSEPEPNQSEVKISMTTKKAPDPDEDCENR